MSNRATVFEILHRNSELVASRFKNQPELEIQVRTRLQALWAQLCEVRSDEIDKDLKYGGGPTEERRDLDTLSQLVYHVDIGKLKHSRLKTAARELLMLFTKR